MQPRHGRRLRSDPGQPFVLVARPYWPGGPAYQQGQRLGGTHRLLPLFLLPPLLSLIVFYNGRFLSKRKKNTSVIIYFTGWYSPILVQTISLAPYECISFLKFLSIFCLVQYIIREWLYIIWYILQKTFKCKYSKITILQLQHIEQFICSSYVIELTRVWPGG